MASHFGNYVGAVNNIRKMKREPSAASEDDIEDFKTFIMGDWNAKIGDNAVEGISGTHGLGDKNEAGERMIGFCEANQLIVTNRGRRGMSARLRLNAPWLENCVRQDCDISHSE